MGEYTQGVGKLEGTTSRASKMIGGALKVGVLGAVGAIGGLVGGMGAYITTATKMALETESARKNFDTLAQSIGTTADAMIMDLQAATRGMVNDADIMAASNMFVAMGLSNTSEETAKLAEMATQLGMAMGTDATTSMADFAAMLANQSIPRLDTFGISSGKVTKRIEELMKADENLTREQAFMAAVMEEGTASMERLGEQGDTTSANMARIDATMANLKDTVGQAFLPVFGELLGTFSTFISDHAPQIQAAFQGIADWMMNNLIPAFQTLWTWLSTNIPPAIRALVAVWTGTLQPALQAVWEFIESNLKPILIGIATVALPVLIAAIISFSTAAIGAAVGLIAAWAPVVIPIMAIIAAVAALYKAWETDLGGIRTFLTNVWETNLKPIFETLVEWLQDNIPKALRALSDFWTNTLQPALRVVWEFIQNNIIPLFQALADVYIAAVKLAIQALAGYWQNVLKPAIEVVWKFISEKVLPVFQKIWEVIEGPLGKAFMWLKEHVLDPVADAFSHIGDVISGVVDWLGKVADTISNITLPDWLTPGSPTPFEMGLRGINSALDEMAAKRIPALNANFGGLGRFNLPAMGTMGAGGNTTYNNSAGGDRITVNVQDNVSAALVTAMISGRRQQKLDSFMGR